MFFSADYCESRGKFLESATRAGAAISSHLHPEQVGPGGEKLYVDVALFGAANAPKVFFNLNGIHGIEAYSGAAAQLQWIDSGALGALPGEVSAVLVHNINPFGWAHNTQLNEDLIDLNRNFVDFSDLPPSDELHHQLAELLPQEEMSFAVLANASAQMAEFAMGIGRERFLSAVLHGQYIAPRGPKYGGSEPAWSNRLLHEISRQYLRKAQKIAYLDWHTGLGEYGAPYELCSWPEGSEGYEKTLAWWGEAAVRRGTSGIMSPDESGSDSVDRLNGLALQALVDAAPGAVIAGGIVEFGTVPIDMISQAAMLDHWLVFSADPAAPETRFWKAQLRTCFTPRDPYWERSVLAHAASLYHRMLDGLCGW